MNTTTDRQRPILCLAEKVSADSLPVSLRHFSPINALEDARALIVFLQGVCAEDAVTDEGNEGFLLVLEFLQDKLEIGMGSYRFPLLTHESDAPALADRP